MASLEDRLITRLTGFSLSGFSESADGFSSFKPEFEEEEEVEPPVPPPPKFKIIEMNDPLDAVCASRDHTQVVAAGSRGVLRIYNVHEDYLDKALDFRSVSNRRLNLLYSPSNVTWSQLEPNMIASTSTNGAVVLWNVETGKLDRHYKVHTRSATVVRFHRTDPNLLISGSKDANVYMYDLRIPETTAAIFSVGSYETIRDMAFCLKDGEEERFFTCDDSGTLRLWDTRNQKEPMIEFPAHQGYAASMSLNPENTDLIATGGGRDKFIKIWNWRDPISEDGPRPLCVVETMAPVGRVYWRPSYPYQIASCAAVNDVNVHIWDIRRPFLPVASFDEHVDSCTDMSWNPKCTERLISCGKDGRLVLHNFTTACKPHDFANDVAMDVAPDGLFALAVSTKIGQKCMAEIYPQRMEFAPMSRRRQRTKSMGAEYDPFKAPVPSTLSCGIPTSVREEMEPDWFYKCAQGYRVGDGSITELCAINARVAETVGLPHVAQTWRLIEALCDQGEVDRDRRIREKEEKTRMMTHLRKQILEKAKIGCCPTIWNPEESAIKSRMAGWKQEEDRNLAEHWKADCPSACCHFVPPSPFSVSTLTATAEFYFGDGEMSGCCQTDCHRSIPSHNGFPQPVPFKSDWRLLKDEAFELRPSAEECIQPESSWKPMPKVAEVLLYHADLGDIQTCACVSLVVGSPLGDVLPERTIAAWLASYIEMLDRLELFVAAAQVRKYSWIKRIKDLTLEGTFLNVSCLRCAKRLIDGVCPKCKANNPECVICEYPLIGQQWCCRKCRHPMHLDEAVQWFEDSSMCPVSKCKCQCKGIGLPNEMQIEPPKPSRRRRISRRPTNPNNTPDEAGIFFLKKLKGKPQSPLRNPEISLPANSLLKAASAKPSTNPLLVLSANAEEEDDINMLKVRIFMYANPEGVVTTPFAPIPPLPEDDSNGGSKNGIGMTDEFNQWVFEHRREKFNLELPSLSKEDLSES